MQLDDLHSAMNVRKQFQDVVVFYIVLMGIDWNSMACDCKGKRGVVVDGTQVAYKSLSSLLSQNWRVTMMRSMCHFFVLSDISAYTDSVELSANIIFTCCSEKTSSEKTSGSKKTYNVENP
jgi:hypothetical protein